MTNTAAPVVDATRGSTDPTFAATLLASWGAQAGAARAALSMIPTSEGGRARQEPLLRELARASGVAALPPPEEAISTSARQLVESTLAGLREPAGARPYDAERSQGLRRRVLRFVVLAVDDAAAVDRRRGSEEVLAEVGALRARQLAGALLAEDPATAS